LHRACPSEAQRAKEGSVRQNQIKQIQLFIRQQRFEREVVSANPATAISRCLTGLQDAKNAISNETSMTVSSPNPEFGRCELFCDACALTGVIVS
jgi:hypothetical protein